MCSTVNMECLHICIVLLHNSVIEERLVLLYVYSQHYYAKAQTLSRWLMNRCRVWPLCRRAQLLSENGSTCHETHNISHQSVTRASFSQPSLHSLRVRAATFKNIFKWCDFSFFKIMCTKQHCGEVCRIPSVGRDSSAAPQYFTQTFSHILIDQILTVIWILHQF